MTIAQHSSETNEHYTPAWLVEVSRAALGTIDLDPASCEIAQAVVKANCFFREQEDGLRREWGFVPDTSGAGVGAFRVFLNPPGGKLDAQTLQPLPRNADGKQGGPGVSSAAVWWGKLHAEWSAGRVHSAIFVCFSMAVFRTTQIEGWDVPPPLLYPFCVPRERVNYDRLAKHDNTGLAYAAPIRVPTKGAPADSAIVYLPPEEEWNCYNSDHDFGRSGHEGIDRFRTNFERFGAVRI